MVDQRAPALARRLTAHGRVLRRGSRRSGIAQKGGSTKEFSTWGFPITHWVGSKEVAENGVTGCFPTRIRDNSLISLDFRQENGFGFRSVWLGFRSAWALNSFRPAWKLFRPAWNLFRAGWEGPTPAPPFAPGGREATASRTASGRRDRLALARQRRDPSLPQLYRRTIRRAISPSPRGQPR